MIDVVVNHFAALGPPDSVDYSSLQPFNSQDYYHSYCSINFNNLADIVSISQKSQHLHCRDYHSGRRCLLAGSHVQLQTATLTNVLQTQVEQCWMGSQNVPLPDLRTEDSGVASTLNNWISGLVSDYSIDGLRIDSAMEVHPNFWAAFQTAAGVYSLGEVYVADSDFVCGYQDYLPGVLNYAM